MSANLEPYLASSEYIDWKDPAVSTRAVALSAGCASDEEIARNCFEFVRDAILHSWDHRRNPVTCKASEVLLHATGYCFAKSHLLAALLRANGIPAGLCYQRLAAPGTPPRHYLHGLNAVHLDNHGWYRMDPRGNRPGIAAFFTPPVEAMPYAANKPGECSLPEIWPEPLPMVVRVLTGYDTVEQVFEHLPDVELAKIAQAGGRGE
ncbi:MAG TPA: transglutaminase family protein [Gallionellaceae bacterium]